MAVNNRFSFQTDIAPGQTDNHIWVDTFTSRPLDCWDWLVPYMRPPDVANVRGIGRADTPRRSNAGPIAFGDGPTGLTPAANRTWPPTQELHMHIPPLGTVSGDGRPMDMPLSPVCYPMHDHSEPSQTAQGGNYNMGLIAGINFIGDRTADANGAHTTNLNQITHFAHSPIISTAHRTTAGAGPRPPFDEVHQGSV
jgi:hypothetical protein